MYWHGKLDMRKHDLAWHKQDILDETAEYYEAHGFVSRWSELSDVVYTYTRAKWGGYDDVKFPFSNFKYFLGILYMFPKFTLRWKFYNTLGKKFDKNLKLTEVRNPKKIEKLEHIAKKYNLDPVRFRDEAVKLMKYWIFLK